MSTRTIKTDAGKLELIPAGTDQLRGIAQYWPMELVAKPDDIDFFGLVFQHGGKEIHGIKLQPANTKGDDALTLHYVNRALIAAAIPHYLEHQHKGLMIPCAYHKEKRFGKVESGIALFVGPDPQSKAGSLDIKDTMFDERLGEGATPMVFHMARALATASKKSGLPMYPIIGMDLRPRLELGGLAMHFAIAGPNVFVIKHPLHEADPVWQFVVRAGFFTLPYAPMRPVGFPEVLPPNTLRA